MKKLNNQKTGNFKKQHHNRKTNWHAVSYDKQKFFKRKKKYIYLKKKLAHSMAEKKIKKTL